MAFEFNSEVALAFVWTN